MINDNRNVLFKLTKTYKQQKQRRRFQMNPGKHWNCMTSSVAAKRRT